MAFTWVVSPCPCVVLSSLVCQVSVGSSGARSYGPVTGQSALVVCRYPFKAGVLSLRFFRRDYVASLGDLPQRGSTPYGMNHHPRVLPQLRHHAVTQGGTASRRGSTDTRCHSVVVRSPRDLLLANAPGVHPTSRPPRPLLDPGSWRMPSVSASTGPFSGPILPPWQKGGDLTTFLGGCGAKLWGSGGAPPTNLILLRNQRPSTAPVAPQRPRPSSAVRRRFGGGSSAFGGHLPGPP